MVSESGEGSKERAHGIKPEISTPWSELRPQGITQYPLLNRGSVAKQMGFQISSSKGNELWLSENHP